MLRRKQLFATLSLLPLFTLACNKPSDDAVTTSIKAKLYSEPLLRSATVDVSAKEGIVTLTGQVPDDAARLAAQHIAATTPGVKTVVDQTTMAPPPPANTAGQITNRPKRRWRKLHAASSACKTRAYPEAATDSEQACAISNARSGAGTHTGSRFESRSSA